MKIGIIGSGDVAQSLGRGLVEAGYEVMLGTRNPEKDELNGWKTAVGDKGKVGLTTQAASFGEVAILAVAWHAAEDILQQVRPELAAKIVIDVTNPLEFGDTMQPRLSVGHMISGGEIVQQSLPDSHVVKTLNIINHAHMVRPKYEDGTPSMFVCGNNDSAKQQVGAILEKIGWKDIIDIGDITKSRLLEPLCLLWVSYGMVESTWDHAFAVLKK